MFQSTDPEISKGSVRLGFTDTQQLFQPEEQLALILHPSW